MITYIYWIVIIAIAFGLLYFIGLKLEELKIAALVSLCAFDRVCRLSLSFPASLCETLWWCDDG